MAAIIGKEAHIPNPALSGFERLIGHWRTSGTHPYLPGRVLSGRTSFEWHEGGAFVLVRSEMDAPEIPSGVAVIGSDTDSGSLYMLYFDERGVSRKYDVALTDRVLSWERLDPPFAQRQTLTLVPGDPDRMSGHGEMSREGGAWEDDLALDYVRDGA